MTENTDPAVDATNQGFHQKSFSNILLLIPTLNEAEAVGNLVVEARASGFANILVVDGFSKDRTRRVAERAGAMVIEQEFGKGKGCGVRTGMKVFLQSSADLLGIIDGDYTNIPSCLKEMIPLIEDGRADVVLGSRIRGKREPGAMSLLAVASNLTVSFLLGVKFRRLFTDVQTGYWLFSRGAVARTYRLLHSTGFEIELELFVTTLREKLWVCEVPVGFRRRRGATKFSLVLRLRNLYYAFKYLSS
jgi:glycosyltransferase involved in cell wall biosynthesis